MVALAVAAMPSSRPVKPRRSLVVAFTDTRDTGTFAISAMRARIASRCGPIFGRSQISVTSRLAIAAAALAHPLRRVIQEAVGRGAFPLHVGRRKMRADIAVGQRAEDGVDQRMQADVAVGMGKEAAIVRHANAADHQVIAVAEGVDVVAGSGADIAKRSAQASLFAGEIFGRGQFHVQMIAFKGRNGQSGPFGQRRVVGEIVAGLARSALVCGKDRVEHERLWCLRNAQIRARRRADDVTRGIHLFDGVGNRDRRDRGAGLRRGLDRAG